ncbi:MAG: prepilin-type N-terminal cleavage/methylation domain-containing protein, partial [Planctomycetes bacterium]|nr:prepilin-type N-terminal cleavage/methylation domain-containing protein [Planctomycetota bacterium]
GFTLLELLAVLLIISILASVLLVSLWDASRAVELSATRAKIQVVETAASAYEQKFGDYPPSALEQVVSNNETNVGIESFVAAMWSDGWEAGGMLSADELINSDEDHSPQRLTDFKTRALLEVADGWKNPIAYFHRRDYGREDRYVTIETETGRMASSVARAQENPRLRRYYRAHRFQLISSGPDGTFGTEDDVANFDQ